jgi:hypothetical protein
LALAGFKKGKDGRSPSDLLVDLGPTLKVDIGLRRSIGKDGKPDLPKKGIRALIDTGAGGDCIDDALARSLGLVVHEEGYISGVGGRHWAATYMARLYVPSLDRLLFQSFTGVKLEEGGQWHSVILGRTFLRRRLVYDGTRGLVELLDP